MFAHSSASSPNAKQAGKGWDGAVWGGGGGLGRGRSPHQTLSLNRKVIAFAFHINRNHTIWRQRLYQLLIFYLFIVRAYTFGLCNWKWEIELHRGNIRLSFVSIFFPDDCSSIWGDSFECLLNYVLDRKISIKLLLSAILTLVQISISQIVSHTNVKQFNNWIRNYYILLTYNNIFIDTKFFF